MSKIAPGTPPDPAGGTEPTAAGWLAAAKAALGTGQYLLAFDDAQRGLKLDAANLELRFEAAKALIELRALDDARALLEEARGSVGLDDAGLAAVAARARASVEADLMDPPATAAAARGRVAGVAASGSVVSGPAGTDPVVGGPAAAADPPILKSKRAEEALGLVGRLLKEIYRETGAVADARRCKQAYLAAYAASGGYWTCMNVATVARILAARDPAGAEAEARDATLFARRSLVLVEAAAAAATPGDDQFWLTATRGEAKLLLGDAAGATTDYAAAAATGQPTLSMRESVRRQLRLLGDHGVAIPPAVDALFRPPAVLCFSGHMIDAPDRRRPRFPAAAEPAVRAAVGRAIDALAAPNLVGYCSGACGGDLIFAELLLERGGQVELFLPFARDDFVETSVRHAGAGWVGRFDAVFARARVNYVTTEPYLGTDALFGHCNRVMAGAAWLRAESFGLAPHLVAAVDPDQPPVGKFGAAQMIAMWSPDRTSIVDIGRLRATAPPPRPPAAAGEGDSVPGGYVGAAVTLIPGVARPREADSASPAGGAGSVPAADTLLIDGQPLIRDVCALLFADVKGFSLMGEEQIPLFMYRFVRRVGEAWAKTGVPQPLLLETWGDAFYCVMPTALAALAYALALREVATTTDWKADLQLDEPLELRVSLHAGPVYQGKHPVTQGRTYFGAHVIRAARIEPITRPGHVYSSLPFVSLLTTEQAEAERAGAGPPPGGWRHRCEYIGQIVLHKSYGTEPLFQVRGR
jgi:class 3 adenylate cyclase